MGDVLTSPLLETLQQDLAEFAATRAQLQSSLGPRHPDMIRISAQISDIDRSIEGELRRRVEELRSNVRITGNRETALRDQIQIVSEQADKLSKDSVRLGQLERSAAATRLVYENFLTRFKETKAQADFQTPEARVIGTAVTPVVPSGPKKTLFLLSTMIMGLAAAIGFVFLRNLVRSPVSNSSELRALTNLPNLAVLPYVRSAFKDKNAWLRHELVAEQGSPYLERVKAIRTELFNVDHGDQPKVIMITSSVPDEGKTSLSCTLAKVLIQPRKSVLLIDADLRRPDIRQALDMPKDGSCLVDFLEGKIKQQNLIQRSELLGIDVIAPCRSTDKASDLLSSPALSGLITRVSQKYDMIVINATPILHLSDTLLLAGLSDATLLAVKCDSTSSKVVTESLHRLEKAKDANVVGTVLTMVRRSHSKGTELDMFNYEY
ncbi:polysaccharide biosynthesis tyrosine autokinase [Roseovarius sp. C03]|uniref:polysaccharide biosynthesis tyrosine autokinase n=1 Tax=Roseovarius sp. C03 TaxID=3449222 RepID=UPI003EDC2A80